MYLMISLVIRILKSITQNMLNFTYYRSRYGNSSLNPEHTTLAAPYNGSHECSGTLNSYQSVQLALYWYVPFTLYFVYHFSPLLRRMKICHISKLNLLYSHVSHEWYLCLDICIISPHHKICSLHTLCS